MPAGQAPRSNFALAASRRLVGCLLVVLGASACSVVGASGVEEEEATQQIGSARCGVERWSVKTGTDSQASSVDISTAQTTLIPALTGLAAPSVIPLTSRVSPTETTAWKLTNVTLTEFKMENDNDYHLVISDGTHTMIAEIPGPSCVGSSSPFGAKITAARAAFDAKYTVSGSFTAVNQIVSLYGVGMFDMLHGQTGVAPNGIELHPVLGICFGQDCNLGIGGGGGGNDFTVAVAPSSGTVAPGSTTSFTVTTAVSAGSADTISLSTSGLPAGVTASFSPSSVTAGASSTLTLNATSGAASGTYSFSVTGRGATNSHASSVSLTISSQGGGAGLVNGDFETGDLSGWTSVGTTSISTTSHGGSFAAQLGSTTPTSGDSSLSQTFKVPASHGSISFWYQVVCPDTVQYDWATAELRSTSGSVVKTLLTKTCSNTGAWTQVQADLSALAGQTLTLVLTSHDDNYSGDPTYTLVDDVILGGTGGTTTGPSVALTAPTGGATVSGTVTLTASASDPTGITRVEFYVDGAQVGTSTSTPYSSSWSSTGVTNGSHTVTAKAYNPAGVVGVSPGVSISVNNGGGGGHSIKTVFIILMENHNWSSIKGSSSAPYINGTLLPQASHAEQYFNPSGNHPSEPNYFWLEAGTNFGILNDNPPSSNHQSTTQHLVTQLQSAGISWKSYQEDISGTNCPLTNTGLYAPKHNPMVFFDDVTNTNSSSSQNCISHVRPYSELGSDLQNNQVPSYVFITPNLCNDMHNSTGCATSDAVKNGDTWLSNEVPKILASSAYQNGGALFITWDESEGGDFPIGMIVLSPFAKGHGYAGNVSYTHASMLRTSQEIFGVSPFLGAAAGANDLSDLFQTFP